MPLLQAQTRPQRNDPAHIQAVSGDDALGINLKKLLSDRVGAIIDSGYVVQYYAVQNKLADQIELAGVTPPSDADKLYIAFGPGGKDAKKYADILSQGLKDMRGSGELAQILARYDLKDWDSK